MSKVYNTFIDYIENAILMNPNSYKLLLRLRKI